MSAKIHKVGHVLDASTSKTEQQAILQLIDEGNSVILDLSACTDISSAGLRVILYTYKVAKAQNQCIYLVGVCPEVREIMGITGFEHFFRFFDTVEECNQQIG